MIITHKLFTSPLAIGQPSPPHQACLQPLKVYPSCVLMEIMFSVCLYRENPVGELQALLLKQLADRVEVLLRQPSSDVWGSLVPVVQLLTGVFCLPSLCSDIPLSWRTYPISLYSGGESGPAQCSHSALSLTAVSLRGLPFRRPFEEIPGR